MADQLRSSGLSPELSGLISLGDQQLRHGQAEEAAVFYCRAYAMEPRATRTYLAGIPPQALQTLVCTLEDFCVCGADTNDLFPKFGIALTLEELCDWILTPELSPRSRVAWSMKSRLQMQREKYGDVIITCTTALQMFSIREISFLLQRAHAYLRLNETQKAVKDFLTGFEENATATEAYLRETHPSALGIILDTFYQLVEKMKKRGSTQGGTQGDDQMRILVKLYKFILMLNPKDNTAYTDCTDNLMKLGAYKEAAVLLSDAIDSFGTNAETLQMIFQRAECYLLIDEVELSLRDYVTALGYDEEVTRVAMLSLSQQNQGKLGMHAKTLSDDLLRHCRIQSKLCSACCVDIQINSDKLARAAGLFRILYLIDTTNIEALLNSGECLMLQSKDTVALEVYSLVISLRPKSSRSYCARASCLLKSGDVDAAISDYNHALELQTGCIRALTGRMRAYLLCGQLDKAVEDLMSAAKAGVEAVVENINDFPPEEKETCKVQLKSFLGRSGKKIKAGDHTEKDVLLIGEVLTLVFSGDLDSHLVYVELLVSLQKLDESQAMLTRFIQQNPGEFLASLHLAMLRMRVGSTVYALDELTTLLRTVGQEKFANTLMRFPESERAKVSREALAEGLQLNGRENDGAAITYFTLAIVATPMDSWEAYYQRGKRYFKLKKPRFAYMDFSAVLSIKPKHVEALCGRAVILVTFSKMREAVNDIITALKTDQKMLANFLKRLPENYKRVMTRTLEEFLQSQFAMYNSHGTKSESILPLSLLLVEVDGNSAANHSTYADALFLIADYKTAACELHKAERLTKTLDMCLYGRSGLAHVKLENYRIATQYFSRMSERDVEGLKTMLNALNSTQLKVISREACSQGEEQLRSLQYAHALPFLSTAIYASNGQQGDYLRMRCKCLERLRMYDRAVEDLSAVMGMGVPLIGDLCARANLHILNGSLVRACEDFMTSLDMNDRVTLNIMDSCPGREETVRAFTEAAHTECEGKKYYEALNLCNYGLKVNPDNGDMKRLKLKLELGVSKCVIQ